MNRRPPKPGKRDVQSAMRFYALSSMKPVDIPQVDPVRERKAPVKRTGPTPEARVNIDIRKAFKGDPRTSLFRNNRGLANYNGALVTYGVGPNGAGDWIGWRTVVITPAMVGTEVAVFVSVEAKAPGEKPDADQTEWAERVTRAGGRAGVAHSDKEAIAIVDGTNK